MGHGGSSALGAAGILLPGQMPQLSSVLLISNLNEEVCIRYSFVFIGLYHISIFNGIIF